MEIQILPEEDAWHNSAGVGLPDHEGGSAMQIELESVSDKFGVFPATLMLPRSIETASIAISGSLKTPHPKMTSQYGRIVWKSGKRE